MRHLTPVNRKAKQIDALQERDVVALQQPGTSGGAHIPLGCSFVFAPGWEADSSGGTVAWSSATVP